MKWHWITTALTILGLGGIGWALRSKPRTDSQVRPGIAKSAPAAPAAPAAPDWFSEEAHSWGVTEVHDFGPLDDGYFMPQILGSGIALFDADQDGRLDLLILNNGGPRGKSNRLYLQKTPGRLQLAPAGCGLDYAGYCMGVAVGDLDRDGCLDLLITEYPGAERNGARVFLNLGAQSGKFLPLGLGAGFANPGWGTSCAIGDLDRDGWPDLAVANYLSYDPTWPCTAPSGRREYCPPSAFGGQPARIWRNLGSDWKNQGTAGKTDRFRLRFEEKTGPSGLGAKPGPGLGLVIADFNQDDWLDLLIANDGQPNHLWMARPGGTYGEEALERGIAYNISGKAQAGMGIAFGDFQHKGRFDLFMPHLAEETHTLWQQTSTGLFRDRTAMTGLLGPARRSTGFGVLAADFDLDGELDLILANGRIAAAAGKSTARMEADSQIPSAERSLVAYQETNQAFQGIGQGRFTDICDQLRSLCGEPNVARGLAMGDLNQDGLPDLVVSRIGQTPLILINRSTALGSAVVLRERESGAPCAGLVIEKNGPDASRIHGIGIGGSYLSASELAAFVRRSQGPDPRKFEVVWQDGDREEFEIRSMTARIELIKGKGKLLKQGEKPARQEPEASIKGAKEGAKKP